MTRPFKPLKPAPAFGMQAGRPFNHYLCQSCGQTTITKHEQDGVTPFMINCYATPGCLGRAYSVFYRGSQDPAQVPHVTWIRPLVSEVAAVIHSIAVNAKKKDPMKYATFTVEELCRLMREHYDLGGCLSREEI